MSNVCILVLAFAWTRLPKAAAQATLSSASRRPPVNSQECRSQFHTAMRHRGKPPSSEPVLAGHVALEEPLDSVQAGIGELDDDASPVLLVFGAMDEPVVLQGIHP